MQTNDVVLNEEQRIELSSIAQSRSLPAGYVFRARLILMLAEGAPHSAIKRQLRTTAPTISRWKCVSFVLAWTDWILVILASLPRWSRPRCGPGSCLPRGENLRTARRIGVAANWLRLLVSAKTPFIAPGWKPA